MSVLKKLREAQSIDDVADILGFQKKAISYILYIQPESHKYKEFDIPKKSGGVRHILAPQGALKLLQRRLADVLQDCLDEINNTSSGKEGSVGKASHGFKRGRSSYTNARNHRNQRYVFNIDLSDFFDSINFGRVRGFFIKDKRFCLNPKVATILAQIACFKKTLPQGSPCSPVISNLIGNILDNHLIKLASQTGCTYTRYADDITFSTYKQHFPQRIAIQDNESEHTWIPSPELLHLVKQSGFEINSKKTRMQYHGSRQEVTGLIVNKKVNTKREYRHNVRAMVHHLFRKGVFFLPKYEKDTTGQYSVKKEPGSLNQLHGRLGFISTINRYSIKNSASPNQLNKSWDTLYRRFLFYKEFYAASLPVLICEGWTDYIYIENALTKLASNYPLLVSKEENGKVVFAIKRFNYTKSHTTEILGITGGTGDFKNFIQAYKKEFKHFSAPGMREPVILLVDNDKAGREVRSAAHKKYENADKKVDQNATVLHVHQNLYLILTPLKEGQKESQIEDFFDASTLDIKIDGKSFNRSNEKATETTYGKAVFARKVVQEMASSISFEGFIPLLDLMIKVIEMHYAKRKK